MLTILFLLAASIVAGYFLRHKEMLSRILPKSMTFTVIALLFLFGMSIGSNESIVANLHNYGMKACLIALLGVAGSICATTALFHIKKKGERK